MMLTVAILTIANINHADFFIACKTMLRNRVENRTYCLVLKDEGGLEPIMHLYVIKEDAFSLRSCFALLGFSLFLQQLNFSLRVEKTRKQEFSALLLPAWKELRK